MLAVAAALPEGPTARLTVDNAYPAVGEGVHFNASANEGHDAGNGRIVAYRFSFGDGQATGWQSSPYAEHAYAAEGSYAANVTVKDNRGEMGSASVTIQVGTPPPPPVQAPDLVPIQVQLSPAAPRVNESVNATVVVLNRGGDDGSARTVAAKDGAPKRTEGGLGSRGARHALSPYRAAARGVGALRAP